MKKYTKILILVNLLLFIIYASWATFKQEKIIKEGKLIFLELAPYDPRSLMQGDYMDLRYSMAIAQPSELINSPDNGYIVVNVDTNGVAEKVRLQEEKEPLNNDQLIIKYRMKDGDIVIGAESYFFEEGSSYKFEEAEYGGIKVNKNGIVILEGLYNKEFKLIK